MPNLPVHLELMSKACGSLPAEPKVKYPICIGFEVKAPLHVPSTSPFFVPFKNGFNSALWCYSHI